MINYACHHHIIYRKYTISSYDDCYQWRKRWVISNSKTQIVLKDLGCCFGASDTSFSPTSMPKIGSPWSAWWEHVCDQNCKCTAALFAGKLSALHVKIKLLLVSSKQLQDMQSVAIWVLGALHPIHFKPCRLFLFVLPVVKRRSVSNYLNLNLGYLAVSIPCDCFMYAATRTPMCLPLFQLFLMVPSCQIHLEVPQLSTVLLDLFLAGVFWCQYSLEIWYGCAWPEHAQSSIEHVTSQILTKPALQVSRFKQKTPFRIIISPILILKQQSSNRITCSVLVAK